MRIGVIGGGPAGLFTALGLRARGYDVLVTEAGDYDTPRAGEHLVAEALHELRKAGVPEVLLFENSLPCTQVKSAWGRGDLHSNESLFNPFGDGFILSRPGFDKALMQYGREQGVEVRTQCRVARVEREEQTWTLHLGNERLSVDFLVDATGRNSKFRLDPRAEKKREDHLVGISRAVTLSGITKVENTYLLVEAVENGWWYSVQLASGEWVGTFMTDAHLLSENKGPSEEFWEEQLGKSVHTQ
ncbi:MAG: NAD(P)/FAD-dependent oxidoreductase, partial [Owenweeksia sp.]